MGKKATPRDLRDNEARAVLHAVRTSPRKLNLVAESIRGLKVSTALSELAFSRRRIAKDVRKTLQSAIANAENNNNLDVDRLVVAEATVGRGLVMKRFRAQARGRGHPLEKPFSNLTLIVREQEESA
ncbi:MAG: 50S ribosomal protein L22 [Alphaproteobacteria bacterium]|nr:50S ribosomal protein L22 [Alphaproteobacteria bacterium]